MKFDVIVGNPPYQLSVGNTAGNSSKAKAIYHMFVSQAIKLNPRYLCMITPSRWMTKTTEGIPEAWVDEMLRCNHFIEMHDFEDAGECFPGVEIKGGVNYFLWNRSYEGKCRYYYHSKTQGIYQRFDYLDSAEAGIVIRDPQAYGILNKIIVVEGRYFGTAAKSFSSLVSPKDFFTNKQVLTSSWDGFSSEQSVDNNIKYYVNKNIHKVEFGFVPESIIPKNTQSIKLNKVYIPAAGGTGNDAQVLGRPFYGEPGSVCSQTYLVIGYDPIKHNFSKQECENIITYIQTRFFRYLVSVKKKTQNGPRGVYQFAPLQDFTRSWSDEELYEKYKLSSDDIALIEETISPMDLEG